MDAASAVSNKQTKEFEQCQHNQAYKDKCVIEEALIQLVGVACGLMPLFDRK